MNVRKRDGRLEPLNIEKLHKVVIWSTNGLTGVSASEVEIKSQLQFYDGITTTAIQETLIKAAADLISEETPNYQTVAGRLINYHIRKEVYGSYEPMPLLALIRRNVDEQFYDPELLTAYTPEEWERIESFIDHERDMSLVYAAMEQFRGKYLVQNRVTKQLKETPQVAYALIAASLFSSYPKATRMKYVREYYDAISKHEISLPTPLMSGVRTRTRQFSSCVLVESDDSLKSITATSDAVVHYVASRAGIGIGGGRIRPLGSAVRNGESYSTGVVPFYKLFQASVRSCSQGSVRSGAATLYFPIWHYEIEDMIVLKNNKGTEDTRIRHMDYGVQFNKLFYERLITGGNITLFSPADHPEMYEAFFNNPDRFRALYEAAENGFPKSRRRSLPAAELFSAFVSERKDTGRIYLMNVDHANSHSSFREDLVPVRQSNLCCEITLPTRPMGWTKTETHSIPSDRVVNALMDMQREDDVLNTRILSVDHDQAQIEVTRDDARISLCTLSAINWGLIREPSDFERPCRLAVRALDALLDYQNYPVRAARLATMEHRPLGVGIINLAYWIAKNGLRYTDGSALAKLDEFAEAWSYYLIKASVDLAEEKGACQRSTDTKYSLGVMPIDTRKIEIDELVPHQERMDWATLRERAKRFGIRNATLMAIMPAETSAQIANATNGIEPPRALVSVKQSKDGVLKQVVPEFRRLKKQYELLWDQRSPEGYLDICAVLQKYVDQAISVNTSYDPAFYENGEIPLSEMISHILRHYRYGGKTLYYNNTNDGAGEINVEKMLAPEVAGNALVGLEIEDEAECDACTI